MRSTPPRVAALALVAAAGCASQADVVLTVEGEAPGAVVMFVRLVDVQGASDDVRSAGTEASPVAIPATIHLRLTVSRRVGAVVWFADSGGTILAVAETQRCFDIRPGSSHKLTLSPAANGWSPASIDRCRCNSESLDSPMCATDNGEPAVPDAASGGDALGPAWDAAAPDASLADTRPGDATGADPATADARVDGPAASADGASRDTRAPDAGSTVRVPNALFGFESLAPDWSSAETTLTRDTTQFTEGTSSIAFTLPAGGGAAILRSRAFDTGDLNATGTLSVDIFVGQSQAADAKTEMWVDCPSASVNGVYLDHRALSALKVNGWTSVTYELPAPVLLALLGTHPDCKTWFQTVGRGLFRFDRMGFLP